MTLLEEAKRVRENAYAPYSGFKVGAALETRSGLVFKGCNVENAAYPEGTCAEAGAIAAMVASGQTDIVRIAIVADSPDPVSPCGGCRQKLAEFCDEDIAVTMATMSGTEITRPLTELLPAAFEKKRMAND